VRTTVFLKGCPLRCRWCHNPESWSGTAALAFYTERCARCGSCVRACPNGAHIVDDGPAGRRIDRTRCVVCGLCVDACPNDALELLGSAKSPSDVMAIVNRDKPYYEHSGGGLTISGGEPMAQFAFTRALVADAKKADVHTCIETCGFAARERLAELAPLVDLFLFDIKGIDDGQHRRNTGVSNAIIIENLRFLLAAGARVTIRCPLVPGANDSDRDLRLLGAFYRENADALAGIQIMPYHAWGRVKAERIGDTRPPDAIPTATDEQIARWTSFLRAEGCPV
jgi:glycyl-radical enzyme activating protein